MIFPTNLDGGVGLAGTNTYASSKLDRRQASDIKLPAVSFCSSESVEETQTESNGEVASESARDCWPGDCGREERLQFLA